MTLAAQFSAMISARPSAFEPKPRFRDAPPLCIAANLPSFESIDQANAWWRSWSGEPPQRVKRVWRCEHCLGVHVWTRARGPSGSSSGTERE